MAARTSSRGVEADRLFSPRPSVVATPFPPADERSPARRRSRTAVVQPALQECFGLSDHLQPQEIEFTVHTCSGVTSSLQVRSKSRRTAFVTEQSSEQAV